MMVVKMVIYSLTMVIFHSYVTVYQRVLGIDGDGDILYASARLMELWP